MDKKEYELVSDGKIKGEVENVRFAWRPLEVSNRLQDQTSQFQLFLPSPCLLYTSGEGKTAVSVSQPVFFHFSIVSDNNVQLEYTPFVFQVNPMKGGISEAPNLGTGVDKSTFRLDYRCV